MTVAFAVCHISVPRCSVSLATDTQKGMSWATTRKSEQNGVVDRRVDHWLKLAYILLQYSSPPQCLILWWTSFSKNFVMHAFGLSPHATAVSPSLEVLEAPEDEAAGDVMIPTPFFPPCVRRPSSLDHRRGHTSSGLPIEGMLTISLVPHSLTRLCTEYCFCSQRT
jgi:hypothetical protein